MAELEEFIKVLAETVKGNKLSSSRVERVKLGATSCFKDAALPRAMLKVHLRAGSGTKISSLYLFDAVARHARDLAKKSTSSEANAAATFLDGAAPVAPEIARDTMRSVKSEQHDKVRKVVDIWVRAGTFDARMLKDLQRELTKKPRSTTPTGDPRDAKRRPPYPLEGNDMEQDKASATPNAQPGLPASVLALLGGSAATPPSTAPQNSAPSFDLSQLTALQNLAAPAPAPAPRHEPTPPPRPPPQPQPRPQAQQPAEKPQPATFDMSRFDPTDASQWQQLGEMWKASYGYLPANQELMFAVMGGMFPPQPGMPMGMMGGGMNQSQGRANGQEDYTVPLR